MGIDLTYFSAPGDDEAAAAAARPGGPLGLPVVPGPRRAGLFRRKPGTVDPGPGWPGFATRGWEPTVVLARLEALLTGRSYDEVTADPRWASSPAPEADEEFTGVLTVTDGLRDALAATSDDRLAELVGPWSRTEELQQAGWYDVGADEHLDFLRRLRDLARQAAAAGHRLYCWYEL